MNDTDELEFVRRKRSTPTPLAEQKQVRGAVAHVVAVIRPMQLEAAFLRGMSLRSAGPDDETRSRRRDLERRLQDTSNALEAAVKTLPEGLRDHPRLRDARGALHSVKAALGE